MSTQSMTLALLAAAVLGAFAAWWRERRAHDHARAALAAAGVLYRETAARLDAETARAERAEVQRESEAWTRATTSPPAPLSPDDAHAAAFALLAGDPRVWGPVVMVVNLCDCGRCAPPRWAPVHVLSPSGTRALAFVTRWGSA